MSDRAFILGVDLDGVCGDHTMAFRQVVAEEFGVEPSSLPLQRSWGFEEWGMGPDDFERLHRIAVMQKRMFRDMPVVRGAPESLWRLSDAGIWIRIITHRLYVNWGHEIAIADTAHWLDNHRLPYRDLCFLGAKPEVEADMYVDDAPHNVENLRAQGNEVIIFDQPYNQGIPGLRAHSWPEVEEIVVEAASRTAGIQTSLPGMDPHVTRLDVNRSAAVESNHQSPAAIVEDQPLLEDP